MNIVYTVTVGAEAAKVDRVRRSVELCLEAAGLDARLYTRVTRVSSWALGMGISCGAAPGHTLAFRLVTSDAGCSVSISGACSSDRAADAVRALSEVDTVVATTALTPELQTVLDEVAGGTCALTAMTDGTAFMIEAKLEAPSPRA